MGSLAMLLLRPDPIIGTETVNDADGFLANFWRAVQRDPEAVARWADWPVNENDLHPRHIWLKGERSELTRKLEGDPHFFDAKIAGWWVWGQCCWIASGWCDESRSGPWGIIEVDGNRQLVHLGNAGHLIEYFGQLSDRLRQVRVCSGDWTRVCGPTPTFKLGLTAVFLDPPYADTAQRTTDLYSKDSESVAHAVRKWALANGDNPKMRIALCGYQDEHKMPKSWECLPWKTSGGYGRLSRIKKNDNANRERIWFSPHCLS
jgi:DNA adenine methylase